LRNDKLELLCNLLVFELIIRIIVSCSNFLVFNQIDIHPGEFDNRKLGENISSEEEIKKRKKKKNSKGIKKTCGLLLVPTLFRGNEIKKQQTYCCDLIEFADYFRLRFSGRKDLTAWPACHISELRI